MHGANWIILKTKASINEHLKTVIFRLNIALAVLTGVSLMAWKFIVPSALDNFVDKPYLLVFPLIYFSSLIGLFFIKRFKNEMIGFALSTLLILGGITSSLASLFPVVLPSTNNINESLTIYNTSTTEHGLSVAMGWVIIGLILLIIYTIVQKKLLGGKIDDMDYGH